MNVCTYVHVCMYVCMYMNISFVFMYAFMFFIFEYVHMYIPLKRVGMYIHNAGSMLVCVCSSEQMSAVTVAFEPQGCSM